MYDFPFMQDQEELKAQLMLYRHEHKELDAAIADAVGGNGPVNMLEVQALKKKKLWLKDMIQKLESGMIDDIIA